MFCQINSFLLNLLCVWILFQNASSHSCFSCFAVFGFCLFVGVDVVVVVVVVLFIWGVILF